jgi:phage minor structural protein
MSLIHILDRQTDHIIGTLSLKNAEYWGNTRKDSLENENTFDFIANASLEKSTLLEKRNKLLIQDEDGIFREFIIVYAEQYKRNEKSVRSNASFTDLAKAKVIDPQVLQGATSTTAIVFALEGTEWTPGIIEYNGINTITLEDYTNPLALLKLIASTFELEISYRIEIVGNQIVGRYVDMRKQIAGFEGKEITFGKDLVGVKRKEDSLGIVTALLGIGPEKEDGSRLSIVVEDKEALQRWGRNGQHLIEPYEPQSSDKDMTLDRLTTLTENELEKRIDSIVSYECEAVSIEHVKGFSHEKIRVGQTVRIKDDYYQPPLYVEGRIQEVEREHSTKRIRSFKIGNFIEYKKADLEKQVKVLKAIIAQKATHNYVDTKADAVGKGGTFVVERPDGYMSMQDGIMSNSFNIQGSIPTFKAAGVVEVGQFYRTNSQSPLENIQRFVFKHDSRYVRIIASMYCDGGVEFGNVGRMSFSVFDDAETTLITDAIVSETRHSSAQGYRKDILLDLGTPTGELYVMYWRMYSSTTYHTYGSIRYLVQEQ